MVFEFQKQKERQKIMVYILIGIILITAVFLINEFLIKEGVRKVIPLPAVPASVKKIEINFEFLDDKRLKEFLPFEKIPPLPEGEQIGRENPFINYEQ